MKKTIKSIISVILAIATLLCATVPAFAAEDEEYICDLRIIYADDYDEAKEILAETEFSQYKLLNENLNVDTGEDGVWLAYKTTTDIEDAITDMAIMDMGGGYNEGNFQQMIEESYNEYVEMGEIYLDAIEYFVWAYDEGDFLADAAYRQLNFYNVETQEDPSIEIPRFEGELLGDIFYDGIDENELATMFLEGNSYALQNIRSLISMGVSYNEDGLTYLQKVSAEAAKVTADPKAYDDEDYDDLADLVAVSMSSVRSMLNELAICEDELDFTDEELTELEISNIEIKAIADMLRELKYLNNQSLYDFIMTYKYDKKDLSPLYPLVAALNDGQIAMTKVAHYYDVLRYSVMTVDEDYFNEKIEELEETYSEEPFNIYTGVDRTIYKGTFALTTAADRADAYAEMDLMDEFLGTSERKKAYDITLATGILSLISIGAGIVSHLDDISIAKEAAEYAGNKVAGVTWGHNITYGERINDLFTTHFAANAHPVQGTIDVSATYTFTQKVELLKTANGLEAYEQGIVERASNEINAQHAQTMSRGIGNTTMTATTAMFYVIGGALLIYSAFNIISTVYNYYHPDYDDIPIAMVDLIETIDGDRYIKYDVVYEAETRNDGKYAAGDLNAFEGKRWNALYYTKSYEAGKPLLADEFIVSNSSNQPKANYTAVHAFGDTVCFDLNRHTFDDDTSIYLSAKQSKNDKYAATGVPEVVGSMFGAGFLFLAGGIGAAAGVGGTLATYGIAKRKKSKTKMDAES